MLLGVTSGCEGHKGLTEAIALIISIDHSADGITETAASAAGTWLDHICLRWVRLSQRVWPLTYTHRLCVLLSRLMQTQLETMEA